MSALDAVAASGQLLRLWCPDHASPDFRIVIVDEDAPQGVSLHVGATAEIAAQKALRWIKPAKVAS